MRAPGAIVYGTVRGESGPRMVMPLYDSLKHFDTLSRSTLNLVIKTRYESHGGNGCVATEMILQKTGL